MSQETDSRWLPALSRTLVLRVIVFLSLAAVPLVTTGYQTGLVIDFLILALFAVSYDLLIGYTGIVSFGHALPYGLGLYVFAIFATNRSVPFVPTGAVPFEGALLVAVLLVVVVSLVTGYLALQASGVYFAMITLAFAQIGYLAVFENTDITGGDGGILLFSQEFFGLALGDEMTFYYLTLVVVAGCFLAMRRLTTSPYGQVLKSIRENETRARFLGYDTFRYKLSVFVAAGVFAAVAGILKGLHSNIATPNALHWSTGGDALLMTLIGGMGTLWGPLVGAAVLFGGEELLTTVTEHWLLLLGAVYVVFVIFVPSGIAGLVSSEADRTVGDVLRELRP
ncbi:branched-chain amino acid ABC transporter permease [Haloglomus litoreum]|uniref:branched-chain amino acid ABC transporter permease n=1 Tax=Haloglomus litoreum TaxID=3034026 RepID=UPI0023E81BA7|nr:branched-chain amino acid ABC transporter permease [Haloglomus sp. DT116]